jgi:hypothetical protein
VESKFHTPVSVKTASQMIKGMATIMLAAKNSFQVL